MRRSRGPSGSGARRRRPEGGARQGEPGAWRASLGEGGKGLRVVHSMCVSTAACRLVTSQRVRLELRCECTRRQSVAS